MIKLLILSFLFYMIIHTNTFYQNSKTYNGWPIRPLSFLQVPTVQPFKVSKKLKKKKKNQKLLWESLIKLSEKPKIKKKAQTQTLTSTSTSTLTPHNLSKNRGKNQNQKPKAESWILLSKLQQSGGSGA